MYRVHSGADLSMQSETYGTGSIKQSDTVHLPSPWPCNLDQSGHQSAFNCRNVMWPTWLTWIGLSPELDIHSLVCFLAAAFMTRFMTLVFLIS